MFLPVRFFLIKPRKEKKGLFRGALFYPVLDWVKKGPKSGPFLPSPEPGKTGHLLQRRWNRPRLDGVTPLNVSADVAYRAEAILHDVIDDP